MLVSIVDENICKLFFLIAEKVKLIVHNICHLNATFSTHETFCEWDSSVYGILETVSSPYTYVGDLNTGHLNNRTFQIKDF